MERDMFVINKEKEQRKGGQVPESVFYTIIGSEDYLLDGNQPCVNNEDSEKIFAKRIKDKRYILRNSAGNFLNPIDAFNTPNPKATRNGNSLWSWVEVEESTFAFYLRFLRTQNHTWLRQAERKL